MKLVLFLSIVAVGAAGAIASPIAAQQPCTTIGCESGVDVQIAETPKGAAAIDICVDRRCRRIRAGVRRALFVPVRATAVRTVVVTVRFIDARARVIAVRTRRVKLRAVRPNGDDCPPTCYQATVRVLASRVDVGG